MTAFGYSIFTPFSYFPATVSMYCLIFSIEFNFLPLTLTTASACCAIALAVFLPTPNTQRNSSSVTSNLFFSTSVSLLAYFVFSNFASLSPLLPAVVSSFLHSCLSERYFLVFSVLLGFNSLSHSLSLHQYRCDSC